MSYVYGLGAVAPSVPYVPTPTLEGDGFQSLFNAYKSVFPAGTTVTSFAKAICAANGISYTVPAIESWIFGMSGRRFPFDPKNNPGMYGGPKNVGWAHFAAGNVIKLPDIPRPGVRPAPQPALPEPALPPVAEQLSGKSPLLYVAAGGLILLALLGGKKNEGAALRQNPRKRRNPRLASDYESMYPLDEDDYEDGLYLDADDLRSMSTFAAPARKSSRKKLRRMAASRERENRRLREQYNIEVRPGYAGLTKR